MPPRSGVVVPESERRLDRRPLTGRNRTSYRTPYGCPRASTPEARFSHPVPSTRTMTARSAPDEVHRSRRVRINDCPCGGEANVGGCPGPVRHSPRRRPDVRRGRHPDHRRRPGPGAGARGQRGPGHLAHHGRPALPDPGRRVRAAQPEVPEPGPEPRRDDRRRRPGRDRLPARRRGVRRRGRNVRRVRPRPPQEARREAGKRLLRTGRGGADLGGHRPTGRARPGPGSAGPERAGRGRLRGGGQLRRADRQGPRRAGHRGVQHREGGPGEGPGRRPRPGLHPGGLRRRHPHVRRHPRHRRQPPDLRSAPRPDPPGHGWSSSAGRPTAGGWVAWIAS